MEYGYSDSNWGGDKKDMKSIKGYMFMIGGSSILWTSKNKLIVQCHPAKHNIWQLYLQGIENNELKYCLKNRRFVNEGR